MKKIIYEINYLVNVMVIQRCILKMILGQDIPFVYPNYECTHLDLTIVIWLHNLIIF
jgi:hypothetical protein